MNLDRFAEGLLDIQDIPVLGHCKVCGDSMYWHRDNMRICDYCEVDIEFNEELEVDDEY